MLLNENEENLMKNKERKASIIGGIFLLLISYYSFLSYGSPSQLFISIIGAYFIFSGLFSMFQNNYVLNKSSYLGIMGMIVYIGLIMIYLYVFNSAFVKDPLFYVFAIMLISFIITIPYRYQMIKKYQNAVKPYENALKVNPDDVNALNNKGAIMVEFKAYHDAIEYFDKVVGIDPNDAAA